MPSDNAIITEFFSFKIFSALIIFFWALFETTNPIIKPIPAIREINQGLNYARLKEEDDYEAELRKAGADHIVQTPSEILHGCT